MERARFFLRAVLLDHGQALGHGQTRRNQVSRHTGNTSIIVPPNHFDFSRQIAVERKNVDAG
jgi:hypothetical protein